MNHSDFAIGSRFTFEEKTFLCTDVGSRTVVAVRVDAVTISRFEAISGRTEMAVLTEEQARAEGWLNGPPYAVQEYLFEEISIECCEPLPGAVP